MPYFAVTYVYASGEGAALAEHRPAHREFLRGLAERGTIVASGPLDEGQTALLIMASESPDAIRAALAEDPFQVNGLVQSATVQPWNPVIGILADQN